MADQSVLLDTVRLYWEYSGADVDRAHEIYHDDAVLEFPRRESDSKASPRSPNGAGSIRPTCATGCEGSLHVKTW
jgi:hypothetical protein